ncbi:hypothetical protein ABL78_7803 [Leptomonas seymouri]|uniref:Uncharacterized protein n=1 Tax=Leptomonas seymouri TaxID=5684 RepID=A0A0N1HTH9_LEPSE|nr:hypothetical protein ABL78_7803 [Leptomonas seymouri]|eukprot:KPI83174.1 hypothetical protein ABL78_7803 [Leptomonas seymouri]
MFRSPLRVRASQRFCVRIPSLEHASRCRSYLNSNGATTTPPAVRPRTAAGDTPCRSQSATPSLRVPSAVHSTCPVAAKPIEASMSSVSSSNAGKPSCAFLNGGNHNVRDAAAATVQAFGEENPMDVDGWSISGALQTVFPPTPTITGFRTGRLFRSSRFHYMTHDLLMVPERRAVESIGTHKRRNRDNDGRLTFVPTPSNSREAEGDATAERTASTRLPIPPSSSLLLDAASLPYGVGARALPSPLCTSTQRWVTEEKVDSNCAKIAHLPGAWVEEPLAPASTQEWGSEADSAAILPKPPSMCVSENCGTPISVNPAAHKPETPAHHSGWSFSAAYEGVQVCADISCDSLRYFTMRELGQRTPSMLFLAERPYAAGDENARGRLVGADGHTHRAAAAAENSVSTEWGCPGSAAGVATRRVPIEAYTERIPLTQTSGTAALQLALRRALATATWLAPNAEGQPGSEACTGSSAVEPPHLVWCERDWMVETDRQLAAMEEQLLQRLSVDRHGGNNMGVKCGMEQRQSPLRSSADVPLRAWLPARWATGSKSIMMVPLTHNEKGMQSDLYRGQDQLATEWVPHAPTGTGLPLLQSVGTLHHALHSCSPYRSPPCKSWVFRLRKSWLVTGLSHSTQPLDTTMKNRGDPSDVSGGSAPIVYTRGATASSPLHVSWADLPPQPNYDLLTGMPLNLLWYRWGLEHRETPKSPRRQQGLKQTKACALTTTRRTPEADGLTPAALVTSVPLLNDAEGVAIGSPITRATSQDAHLSALSSLELSPLQCAIQSQRVGWIRVQRQSSQSTSTAGRTTQWCLPPAFQSFLLPEGVDRVRAPQLTDSAPCRSAFAPASSSDSCCHGVTVPQRTWYTGFFFHDAPPWWADAVCNALKGKRRLPRAGKTEQEEDTGGFTQPEAGASERGSVYSRWALLSGNAGVWIDQLIEQRYIPALPEEVLSAVDPGTSSTSAVDAAPSARHADSTEAAEGLKVCVLRFRGAPPTVLKKGGDRGMHPHAPPLDWATFHDDSSVATVNFVYTLKDVVEIQSGASSKSMHTPPDTPSAPPLPKRDLLFFVEVKAALEVLRRVTVETDTAASSSWWPLLEAFYRDHTVEWKAGDEGDQVQLLNEKGLKRASGTSTVVPAYCHPTTSEVAHELLRLVTQRTIPPPSPGSVHADSSHHAARYSYAVGSVEHAKSEVDPKSVALSEWPRDAYHKLTYAALVAAPPFSSPAVLNRTDGATGNSEEQDDSGNLIDTTTSGNRAICVCTLDSEGAVDADPVPPDSEQLPFGTVVHTYDEDGTRIYENTHTDGASARSNVSAYSTDPKRRETCTRGPASPPTASQDRPAADRRSPHHRGHQHGAAIRQTSSLSTHVLIKGPTNSPKTLAGGGAHKTGVPHMHFPSSPPVAIGVLGIERASSIVAANEQSKQYGYLPVMRERKQRRPDHPSQTHSSPTDRATNTLSANTGPLDAAQRSSLLTSGTQNSSGQEEAVTTASSPSFQSPTATSALGGECTNVDCTEPSPHKATDVIGLLINDEEQRFWRLWKPWLKYLPPDRPQHPTPAHGKAEPSTSQLLSGSNPLANASDPRQTFPFLRLSRLEERHLRTAATASSTPAVTAAQELQPPCDLVQASDIGLSVLHLSYDEVYVNASNLLCRKDHLDTQHRNTCDGTQQPYTGRQKSFSPPLPPQQPPPGHLHPPPTTDLTHPSTASPKPPSPLAEKKKKFHH